MFMKRTADKLFGDDYRWSVLGAGRHQIPFATQAVMMGGNVRVGLEDSLYIGRGQARQEQRRAGREDPPLDRGARLSDRDAGGGARDAGAEGPGPHEVLSGLSVQQPTHSIRLMLRSIAAQTTSCVFNKLSRAAMRLEAWGACRGRPHPSRRAHAKCVRAPQDEGGTELPRMRGRLRITHNGH